MSKAPFPRLLNPAGGLRYHMRALRYRRTLWTPFVEKVEQFLRRWPTTSDRLSIVGASAGWCLTEGWLERFRTVRIVEPDPLAGVLFRCRFRHLPIRIENAPAVPLWSDGGDFCSSARRKLLDDLSDGAILFSNILGQLSCLAPEAADKPSFSRWKLELAEDLARREWASFHDRLSGPLAPDAGALSAIARDQALSDEELVTRTYAADGAPLRLGSETVELHSHRGEGWFPGASRSYFSWQITPGWYHLIEACHS